MKYICINRCVSVSQIAETFQIDKSTASRILSVLAEHDLVYKDPHSLKYYQSEGTLLYSHRIMMRYQIIDKIHPMLLAMAKRLALTVHVCILRDNHVLILDQIQSEYTKFIREPALPGMTEPLYCSGIGKCILAYLPEEEQKRLLKNFTYEVYTENTITDVHTLEKEIEQIRRDGYARDMEELAKGLFCCAVPILDADGYATMSLGVSGDRKLYCDREFFKIVQSDLKEAAKRIAQICEKLASESKQGG